MTYKKAKHTFIPKLLSLSIASILSCSVYAQENQAESVRDEIEKVAVVGTHIKGGQVAEALAVSVITSEDIGNLGIDSVDELLQLIPENGQNFFSEAGNISGGVNSARGDIGTYNLRNLGTGNTLVLMNGRRLVNSAAYQTEEVGGSFVPVNSVNVNTIPIHGLNRVEVLRDGASAIYGADAVAGVVNHVLKSNFVGLTLQGRWAEFDNLPRDDQTITLEWGKDFNDGRTNVSTFYSYYGRDRVNSQDDPRWANSDLSERVPIDSPWFGLAAWRNDSANSLFGQFDIVNSAPASLRGTFTDNAGEFETYPIGDERCQYVINATTCGAVDGQGTFRSNLNADRDLSSELSRHNLFAFINHEFENGLEAFTELSYYEAKTNLRRHGTSPFSTSSLRVGASNYYNPFGPCGSPNRLDAALIGDVPCSGLELQIDNYRFDELPRIVDNDGDTYRFLQGFRGQLADWSWETALSYSKATSEDVTQNRVSNVLITEALFDNTPAAYNPFAGGINSNIERALITVRRDNETELTTFDVKFSHPEIFSLPAGPVGFVLGLEYREETFIDDRDDRLDGTISFTDFEGDTYPFVSDVVNSSPSPDSEGERDVSSLFAEFSLPLHDTINVQAAIRYEDFSDVGDTTVGKLAFGWRPIDMLLVRGSWSEAFRAPNLVTVNESIVARNRTSLTDFACLYASENGGDIEQTTLDCVNSAQRIAQGSDNLAPEESTNTSVGFVLTPSDALTFTVDYWSIEKENTIGLFGEQNHTLLDLLFRLGAGTSNCSGANFNPAVSRQAPGEGESAIYLAAGICPAGEIEFIDDQYLNLDTRNLAGFDVGIYYDIDTQWGDFNFSYNGSFVDKFEQQAGGIANQLVIAQDQGLIPSNYPIAGFADLIGQDGNQEERHSMRVNWRMQGFGASLSGNRIGSFYQNSLTLADGTRYTIPSMTTYNATFDYRLKVSDVSTRLRLGIRNLTDERAPLADGSFGYFVDAHTDFGRSYYVDVQAKF